MKNVPELAKKRGKRQEDKEKIVIYTDISCKEDFKHTLKEMSYLKTLPREYFFSAKFTSHLSHRMLYYNKSMHGIN